MVSYHPAQCIIRVTRRAPGAGPGSPSNIWYMAAPPSSPRVRALANALRKARESRGISVREVGRALGISHGIVSFWERGQRVPSVEDVGGYCVAVGIVGDEKERILELARNANSSDQNWLPPGPSGLNPALAGVLDCEATAVAITQWTPMVIPGLLQTPEYAKAMLTDEPGAGTFVSTRVARRSIITRDDQPVEYAALISEFALTEMVSTPAVHAEQLDYLLALGAQPNVAVRIVRLGQGWHPGFLGPFIIYDFAESPSIIHIEHYSSSAFLYEEQDVAAFKTAAQLVRSKAMSPEESSELIASVRSNMEMR